MVNDLVAVVAYYGMSWLLLINVLIWQAERLYIHDKRVQNGYFRIAPF